MGLGLTGDSEVVVHDVGVDAVVVETGGVPVLVLRPHMSFGAAVQAVLGVAPHLSADVATRMVRRAMPDAPNLDELLDFPGSACAPTCCASNAAPAAEEEARGQGLARAMRARVLRAVGVAAVSATLGFGVAHVVELNEDMDQLQEAVAVNSATQPGLVSHISPTPRARAGRHPGERDAAAPADVAVAGSAHGGPSAAQLEATRRAVEEVLAAHQNPGRATKGARGREDDVRAQTSDAGASPESAVESAVESALEGGTVPGSDDLPVRGNSEEVRDLVEQVVEALYPGHGQQNRHEPRREDDDTDPVEEVAEVDVKLPQVPTPRPRRAGWLVLPPAPAAPAGATERAGHRPAARRARDPCATPGW